MNFFAVVQCDDIMKLIIVQNSYLIAKNQHGKKVMVTRL